MRRPSCSLCERTGAACAYPTTRKSSRRPRKNASQKKAGFATEVPQPDEDLSTYSWEALFDSARSLDASLDQPLQEPTQAQTTQTNRMFGGPDAPTNCQTTAEIADKGNEATIRDRGTFLRPTFSTPAVWQAEEVPAEAFANVTRSITQDSSFPSNERSWFVDREASAQFPTFDYLDTPLEMAAEHPPNIVDDFPHLSTFDTSLATSTLSRELKSSSLACLSIPDTTVDEL